MNEVIFKIGLTFAKRNKYEMESPCLRHARRWGRSIFHLHFNVNLSYIFQDKFDDIFKAKC